MAASLLVCSITGVEVRADGFLYSKGYYVVLNDDDSTHTAVVNVTGTKRLSGNPDNAYYPQVEADFVGDCRASSGEIGIPSFMLSSG